MSKRTDRIKSLPISEAIFNKRADIAEEFSLINGVVEERLDYVLHKIYELCGVSFGGWYIDGAEEGELGNIDDMLNGDIIECNGLILYEKVGKGDFSVIISNNDKEEWWDLSDAFPRRWLFDDSFIVEIPAGQELFKQRQLLKNANNKSKKEKAKQEKEKLLQSAKMKLSKEELKALGVKGVK